MESNVQYDRAVLLGICIRPQTYCSFLQYKYNLIKWNNERKISVKQLETGCLPCLRQEGSKISVEGEDNFETK